MTTNPSRGVLWLAFGKPHFAMAAHSARTLAEHSPEIGRFLLTNLPLDGARWRSFELFTEVRVVKTDGRDNRLWKTAPHSWAPFDQNIYLDCDTEIRADIAPLFEILNVWPLFARHNSSPTGKPVDLGIGEARYLGVSEWNGGVIGFDARRPEVQKFFKTWTEDYRRLGLPRDQPSLLRTIYNPETIIPMPINGVWNAMNKRSEQQILFEDRPDQIRIFHYVDPSRSEAAAKGLVATLEELVVPSDLCDSRLDGGLDEILQGILAGKDRSKPPTQKSFSRPKKSRLVRARRALQRILKP